MPTVATRKKDGMRRTLARARFSKVGSSRAAMSTKRRPASKKYR